MKSRDIILDRTYEEAARILYDEETAREWLLDMWWPEGRHCPRCMGTALTLYMKRPSHDLEPLHYCRGCRRTFSDRTGTILAKTTTSWRVYALALVMYGTHPDIMYHTYMVRAGITRWASLAIERRILGKNT